MLVDGFNISIIGRYRGLRKVFWRVVCFWVGLWYGFNFKINFVEFLICFVCILKCIRYIIWFLENFLSDLGVYLDGG